MSRVAGGDCRRFRPAWSSWSFLRSAPTAAKIEAEARALKSSGLSAHGHDYVNLDDFWYQCPVGVVANYVHRLGLKFGLYVTPGISKQAVAQNTPIEGTSGTADQIATTATENNYNCGGLVGGAAADPPTDGPGAVQFPSYL